MRQRVTEAERMVHKLLQRVEKLFSLNLEQDLNMGFFGEFQSGGFCFGSVKTFDIFSSAFYHMIVIHYTIFKMKITSKKKRNKRTFCSASVITHNRMCY